jgi:NADH-ubiquinone oxidoreductase chain 4
MSLYGIFEQALLLGVLASSSIILSAVFTMYAAQRIIFGGSFSKMFTVNIPDLNKRETSLLLTLVIPTVLFGIYPAPVLDAIHYSVSSLIYSFDLNVISCEGPMC